MFTHENISVQIANKPYIKNPTHKINRLFKSVFFIGTFTLVPLISQSAIITVCAARCDFTSIQTAINVARSGDIIRLESYLFKENVIIQDKALTIEGGKASQTTIKGRYFSGISPLTTSCSFPDLKINITNITLTGANSRENETGGGYRNFGCTVKLKHSIVRDNQGSFSGGIMNTGDLTLLKTLVTDNLGENGPGGIINTGKLVLNNSRIYNNISKNNVGGISNQGTLLLKRTSVTSNRTVTSFGLFASGGIYNNGDAILDSSIIATNRASGSGGGIYNDQDGTLILQDSFIDCNLADDQEGGGGIFNAGEIMSMKTKIRGNSPENCQSSNNDFSCTWTDYHCPWWD